MVMQNKLQVLINSQYVNNRHANKQLVNSKNWSYIKVLPPPFMFHRGKSIIQVWNHMRVSKIMTILYFEWTILLTNGVKYK